MSVQAIAGSRAHGATDVEAFTAAMPFRGTVEYSISNGVAAFRVVALADPDNIVGESLAVLQLDLPSIMVNSTKRKAFRHTLLTSTIELL